MVPTYSEGISITLYAASASQPHIDERKTSDTTEDHAQQHNTELCDLPAACKLRRVRPRLADLPDHGADPDRDWRALPGGAIQSHRHLRAGHRRRAACDRAQLLVGARSAHQVGQAARARYRIELAPRGGAGNSDVRGS